MSNDRTNVPAFRAAVVAFRAEVDQALTGQGAPPVADGEMGLLIAATKYGIGPYDTAAQLIADRADHAD